MAKAVTAPLAVAVVAWFGWQWQARDDRDADAAKLARAASEQAAPPQPPAATADRDPVVAARWDPKGRSGQPLPPGSRWQAGDVRGEQWPAVGRQTAWLLVAPDAGEDPQTVQPLLQGLWRNRDLGAVVLAAPSTPSDTGLPTALARGRHRLTVAVDQLTQQGQMVVLLGSRRQGEAALQLAADPRVLAVAALEPEATAAAVGEDGLRAAAAKKRFWLGGPATCANRADALSRLLVHTTVAARGRGSGLQWLAEADQRASLAGWLHSALGPAK